MVDLDRLIKDCNGFIYLGSDRFFSFFYPVKSFGDGKYRERRGDKTIKDTKYS